MKMLSVISQIFIFFTTILKVQAEVESPCPKYFLFEPNKSEDDRWYGLITLDSKLDITGVALNLKFDKSIIQLGNWLGEVKSNSENTEFIIRNEQKRIKANKPEKVEIFVVYDPYYDITPPILTKISLNGREICPNYEEQDIGERSNEQVNRQWPWHAAIYIKAEEKRKYICGGTLITERHILTAAHCITKKTDCTINCIPSPRDPEEIIIILDEGKYGFYVQGRNEQVLNVSSVTVHPQYNAMNFFNDISILHLETAAQFTNYVRPCCIWEEDVSFAAVVGRTGIAVGWGRDHKNNEQTDLLMQAAMPVVDTLTCIYANREVFAHITNSNNFCAGFGNGKYFTIQSRISKIVNIES